MISRTPCPARLRGWRSRPGEHLTGLAAGLLLALALCPTCLCWADDPSINATSIDSILDSLHHQNGIRPADDCSDLEFLRRVTLDLWGRVPTVDEIEQFQSAPDRAAKIDALLASSRFADTWSEVLTSVWMGYSTEFEGDRHRFRDWLRESLIQQASYDDMAKAMIAAKGQTALDGPVNFLQRIGEEPIIRVSRMFLGVRLDCARCHDHPFDRWKQEDFQRMTQFYEGMRTRQIAPRNIEYFDDPRSTAGVAPADRPRFLTGAQPRTAMWRDELALFITRSRPFARNFANRVFYQLLGRGIVDPPDDFSSANPAVSPELLEHLADYARRSNFSMQAMIRYICNSKAYQRSSQFPAQALATSQSVATQAGSQASGQALSENATPKDPRAVFAVRTIKPLTPEQYIDSMAVALNQRTKPQDRQALIRELVGNSRDEDFSATWQYKETIQSLMRRLTTSVDSPADTVDELFLRTLTRLPSVSERASCAGHSLDTVAYALVQSSEFYFQN